MCGAQAEAFAEKLHADVRTKMWGYSKDEQLDASDLLKIKYQVRTPLNVCGRVRGRVRRPVSECGA